MLVEHTWPAEFSANSRIEQRVILTEKASKASLLIEVLKTEKTDRVLVFTRTKHGADKVVRGLQKAGHAAEAIHGNKSQNQRERVLAAFRNGQPSAIFVIFITSIWPIIINTAVGIRNIPQDYRNVAAVVQLNPLEFFSKIMIPAAAPYIFTGLRIGIGLSWLAIVAAEMLIGGVGIGFFIWDAWNSSHISEIILALFYVGIIGFVLDRLIAGLGKVVTHGTSVS